MTSLDLPVLALAGGESVSDRLERGLVDGK
jgi:hypothetical protein